MSETISPRNRRVLLVDDNPSIHRDYHKVFDTDNRISSLDADEDLLFGDKPPSEFGKLSYDLTSAHQGQEALDIVLEAVSARRPFAVALVDMRMPPGWDGLETVARLWQADEKLLVILCTAYSDYSWSEMAERLGVTDRFVLLKKPFDAIEVQQLVASMVERWNSTRQAESQFDELTELRRRVGVLEWELERMREAACVETAPDAADARLDGVVLLADPNANEREATRQTLAEAGAEVVFFDDGHEVVNEHLRRRAVGETVAGVVLELGLPDLNGYETARNLRSDGYEGPIVARAWLRAAGDAARAAAAGFSAIVPKGQPSAALVASLVPTVDAAVSHARS